MTSLGDRLKGAAFAALLALPMGVAAYMGTWLASSEAAAMRAELVRQVERNTELHTRSIDHRAAIERRENEIAVIQAVNTGRIDRLERRVAAIEGESIETPGG